MGERKAACCQPASSSWPTVLVLAYDLLGCRLVWPAILVSVGVTRIVKPYEKVLQGF